MDKSTNKLVIEINQAIDPQTQEDVQSYTYYLMCEGKTVESDTVNSLLECDQKAAILFGVNNYTVKEILISIN